MCHKLLLGGRKQSSFLDVGRNKDDQLLRVNPSALNAQLEKALVGAYVLFGAEPLMLEEAADQIRTAARQAGVDEIRSMTAGVDLDWS